MEAPKVNVEHAENITPITSALQGAALENHAKQGTETEHRLSVAEALKGHKWAVFWAFWVSMTVIMEGYDTILIGSFYAFPAFQRKYGQYFPDIDKYQLTAPWQSGLGNAAGVGAFFGTVLNGYLVNKFGMKRVILGALIMLTAFIAMTFQAPTLEVLCIGQILCGFPWGIFATTAPAYASEVLPLSLRVYMTSYTNMCFIIGQLIAAGVLAGLVGSTSEWAYRVPFAVQWVWPAILIPILFFAPESPWHLVRHNRIEEAEAVLKRIHSPNVNTKEALALIVHTNNLEQQLQTGTSYWDCFKGTELRRTEIACVAFAGQVFSGLIFASNGTYFFEQVGLDSHTTYNLNVGGTSIALFATLVNWFCIMPYFGRRKIYIVGMFLMTVVLFIIGILNIKTDNNTYGMTQAVLTLVWVFIFQASVGQLGWSYPSEIGSTRLRQKTVCVARNAYYIAQTVANVLQPYFMNPTQWNMRGYTGFVWGGTAFLTAIWAIFRLPEPKGRTFEELDVMFAERVPAKMFAKYEVRVYDDAEKIDEVPLAKVASPV